MVSLKLSLICLVSINIIVPLNTQVPGLNIPPGRNNGPREESPAPFIRIGDLTKTRFFNMKLRLVAQWLRIHKFQSTDTRSDTVTSKSGLPRRYFMEKFPKPRLRALSKQVEEKCRSGFIACVEEIYDLYQNTPLGKLEAESSGYANTLNNRFNAASQETLKSIEYEPFESPLKMFQYRTTASYFMCYFTLQGIELLKKFNVEACNIIDAKINFQASNISYKYVDDFRASDRRPFSCAFFSFCPDVCCGKISGAIKSYQQCQLSVSNPCGSVVNGYCIPDQERNANFWYMVENRINFTCDCHASKPGFRWSMEYRQCLDIDECEEPGYANLCSRKNQTCQNTIGSYFCTCRWGFIMNEKNECERDVSIGYNAIFPQLEEQKTQEELNEKLNIKTDRSKGKTPWFLRAIYKLNYFSARIFNRSMEIMNLIGV